MGVRTTVALGLLGLLLPAALCAQSVVVARPIAPPVQPAGGAQPTVLDVEACVAIAIRDSGQVVEAEARVAEWRGRLAEVEANYYPKLMATTYAAPMYRVRGGPFDRVETDLSQWGPYLHLEALLAQPLYSFGRIKAGKDAAAERTRVEEARVRQVRNTIALETRRLYVLHLYARSMQPALDTARKILDQALDKAREENARGTGRVTMVDLQKLIYGSAELDRYRIQARIGADLALAALKHTMALPQDATLTLADEMLPDSPAPVANLARMLQAAASCRPEWDQIHHGRAAALSLAQAERLANAPLVFAAAQLQADWTPMRPEIENPYFLNRYNQVLGGVAVGLKFDLDPARARARGEQADAMAAQVDALAIFAATGIPMEVRKARDEWQQALEIGERANEGAVAARKWMVFAGTGFATGTVEARDVLEGLVAWLSARRSQIDAQRDAHIARAQLLFAIGQSLDRLGSL